MDEEEGEFLQWFPSEKQARDAIEDFAEIIRKKYPGWRVSRPRQSNRSARRKGWALYALPPASKKEKK